MKNLIWGKMEYFWAFPDSIRLFCGRRLYVEFTMFHLAPALITGWMATDLLKYADTFINMHGLYNFSVLHFAPLLIF